MDGIGTSCNSNTSHPHVCSSIDKHPNDLNISLQQHKLLPYPSLPDPHHLKTFSSSSSSSPKPTPGGEECAEGHRAH
eukprot:751249-Hanusia_phi.AAC.3